VRSLSSTGLATIASGATPPTILLLPMETNPVVRLNSTPFTVSYGGLDWLGAGNFGSVEPVSDAPGDEGALRFTLSGVPADSIALALGDAPDTKGAGVTLSLALLDPATKAISDVLQLFRGYIDQMPISYGAESASISVICSHRGETFSRPKPLRNTDADQQKLYPGDTSRRFVVSQSQVQDVWPAASYFRQ
jgi:hypothetical protein